MKTGFFSALWGVCRGTAIFPRLLYNSRAMAVWHLFLMSLLCTMAFSLRMFPQLSDEWGRFSKRYIEVFGRQVEFSEAGIRPEEEHRPRNMPLPSSGYLVYTAREKKVTLPPEALSTANYLVIWNSNFIAFAVSGDRKQWDVVLRRPHREDERRRVESENLTAYFDAELNRPNSGESWASGEWQIQAEEIFRIANFLTAAGWFVGDLVTNFVLGLICTGFFAGLARLTGAATARGLTGWQYWKVGVYAGFPGMLIGCVVEILDLPILSYGFAYALALVIYWLPAALACANGSQEDAGDPPPAA